MASEPGLMGGPPLLGTPVEQVLLLPSLATQPIIGMVSKLAVLLALLPLTKSREALPGGRPEGLEPCQTLQKGPQSEPALESLFSQFERVVWLPPHRSTEAPITLWKLSVPPPTP